MDGLPSNNKVNYETYVRVSKTGYIINNKHVIVPYFEFVPAIAIPTNDINIIMVNRVFLHDYESLVDSVEIDHTEDNYVLSVGDKVLVELSPYDLTKGRIIFRQK